MALILAAALAFLIILPPLAISAVTIGIVATSYAGTCLIGTASILGIVAILKSIETRKRIDPSAENYTRALKELEETVRKFPSDSYNLQLLQSINESEDLDMETKIRLNEALAMFT